MSLSAAFNIGRSALAAGQIGLQVAGNNMANAATAGYSRQIARLSPLRSNNTANGLGIGAGVQVSAIQRQVDAAIEARLRSATADNAFAQVQAGVYSQIEDALGELGDDDLSSQMSSFFTAWSERANQTQSDTSVVQRGDQLAAFVKRLRGDLSRQRGQVEDQLSAGVARANQLLETVADFNRQISEAEVGGNTANSLRDQRDQAVLELSGLMDVTVIDRGREGVDVLAGSTPVVLGAVSRGVAVRRDTQGGVTSVSVAVAADGTRLEVRSGQLGALLSQRSEAVDATIARLDQITSQLMLGVNKLHSTGANARGLRSTQSQVTMSTADRALALNDAGNTAMSGLPFEAVNGGFLVHVRHDASGTVRTVRVNVDLDGMDAAGAAGTTDDTSAEDILAALDAVPGLNATFGGDGRLRVAAEDGYSFNFAEDSSGVLAVLGVNAYFTGTNASDIAVRSDLLSDSAGLSAGRIVNGTLVENGTALAMAGLQSTGIEALSGVALPQAWRETMQRVGSDAAKANSRADAALIVEESLSAQRAAVSGVSLDEEAINLMEAQRQYEAAARLIAVAQEMASTLLELV